MYSKAIFFDRDGIITKPVAGEAAQSPNDLVLIDEIKPVIQKAKEAGYLIIIISNQPDMALGNISSKTREGIENRFIELVSEKDIPIDHIYYCYHHPKSVIQKYKKDCDCRKPKSGMIYFAQQDFDIDISSSYLLGDRASDIKAGHNAKVKTILYDPEKTQTNHLDKLGVMPDYTIGSLQEVLKIICRQ